MPDKASIMGEILCPTCGEKAWDYVLGQWGVLPSTYAIGDEVRWPREDWFDKTLEYRRPNDT
jgi:hypothetical protein